MNEQIRFNLNWHVKVKLTDAGRNHLAEQKRFIPREDADGWSDWQLWDLIATFGEHIFMGNPHLPFGTEILLIPESVHAVPAAPIGKTARCPRCGSVDGHMNPAYWFCNACQMATVKPLALVDDQPKEPDFEVQQGAEELRSSADLIVSASSPIAPPAGETSTPVDWMIEAARVICGERNDPEYIRLAPQLVVQRIADLIAAHCPPAPPAGETMLNAVQSTEVPEEWQVECDGYVAVFYGERGQAAAEQYAAALTVAYGGAFAAGSGYRTRSAGETALPPKKGPMPTAVDLFDVALDGASKALPVLMTMLKVAGLKAGLMVADEIKGNVDCALKVYREQRLGTGETARGRIAALVQAAQVLADKADATSECDHTRLSCEEIGCIGVEVRGVRLAIAALRADSGEEK